MGERVFCAPGNLSVKQMFTKKDLSFSIITGFITGLIAWRIFVFIDRSEIFGFPMGALIIIVPILWILGVNLGYFLGRWVSFFNQFGRFAAVGFTNAAVDFGVLNFLIWYTGIESGWQYSVFKTISFLVAVNHSYLWNKYWVFEAGSSGRGQMELLKFIGVNVFSIIINVSIATLVVNFVDPIAGLDLKTWANVGAVVGSACALIFTFVGSKVLVFGKK